MSENENLNVIQHNFLYLSLWQWRWNRCLTKCSTIGPVSGVEGGPGLLTITPHPGQCHHQLIEESKLSILQGTAKIIQTQEYQQ